MAACWRELQKIPEVDSFVLAFQAKTQTAFNDQLVEGIPHRLLDLEERQQTSLIQQIVSEQKPDVIFIGGWFHPPYRQLAFTPDLKSSQFIMGMDTPWWGTWKQRCAPWVLRPYLNRFSHVVVTGERSWQYARRLGIAPDHISTGLYGIDYQTLSPLLNVRCQSSWPRSFLFVGRYSEEKGLQELVAAYQQYRQQVTNPWQLVCCGKGELEHLLTNQAGIINRGFVQPDAMTKMWSQAGAFVLPSRFDPWPLALVEAAAAGLPIVCTDVCGSAVEVVRSWYNGLVVTQENVEALVTALLSIHKAYDKLSAWGRRSQQLAAPYAADVWATRWVALLNELVPAHQSNSPSLISNK
ncbi:MULTISPECIES: glycosyltransferase family 4 protein [Cyanophyceae]|uniref:glycosyltransferase family 4 protein n=1 Tax=Cyanophyceae TaxID=3028117 RepID=UPI000ABB9D25|nr:MULTISPECIES: glycosyltransferase family 4 protein [Cyanophyceae]